MVPGRLHNAINLGLRTGITIGTTGIIANKIISRKPNSDSKISRNAAVVGSAAVGAGAVTAIIASDICNKGKTNLGNLIKEGKSGISKIYKFCLSLLNKAQDTSIGKKFATLPVWAKSGILVGAAVATGVGLISALTKNIGKRNDNNVK
ncbi:hypothetical protein II906_00705 [bacterium]|nr:hypothetical protein [bacterium]